MKSRNRCFWCNEVDVEEHESLCKGCRYSPRFSAVKGPGDHNNWEGLKDSAHNPVYTDSEWFLKLYKNEDSAQKALADWNTANETYKVPVPVHGLMKKPITIISKHTHALFTRKAPGRFFQLSKPGHETDFKTMFKQQARDWKANALQGLRFAYGAKLGDCQFFANDASTRHPLLFIDINLKPGNEHKISMLVDELERL